MSEELESVRIPVGEFFIEVEEETVYLFEDATEEGYIADLPLAELKAALGL